MPVARSPFTTLGGVTPCPAGWLAVTARLTPTTVLVDHVEVLEDLVSVLDLRPAFQVAAVDVPIGLHDEPTGPWRTCDSHARRLLGWPRAEAVRPVPSRAALAAASWSDMQRLEPWSRPFDWYRARWVREADEVFQPFHQRVWYSALPDLGYLTLNDGAPVVESPYQTDGVVVRLRLLRDRMPGVERLLAEAPPEGAASVHVIRAVGLLWTARRVFGRGASRAPLDPEWDSRGRRMELVW